MMELTHMDRETVEISDEVLEDVKKEMISAFKALHKYRQAKAISVSFHNVEDFDESLKAGQVVKRYTGWKELNIVFYDGAADQFFATYVSETKDDTPSQSGELPEDE
jgi:hypothetical protein